MKNSHAASTVFLCPARDAGYPQVDCVVVRRSPDIDCGLSRAPDACTRGTPSAVSASWVVRQCERFGDFLPSFACRGLQYETIIQPLCDVSVTLTSS